MSKEDKYTNEGLPPVEHISEQQIRLTYAEIADQTGTPPELDLHGQMAEEASRNCSEYIIRMANAGESCCRVIHGKGTGVLQQVVTKEIQELVKQGVIETYFQSQKYPGAAVIVVFPL